MRPQNEHRQLPVNLFTQQLLFVLVWQQRLQECWRQQQQCRTGLLQHDCDLLWFDAGDVVWQAVLSLVLMNPNKGKGGKKVGSTLQSRGW